MSLFGATCNCFGQDAGACAKSFMEGCGQLIPQLKDCLIDIIKIFRVIPGPISPEDPPIPEPIPEPISEGPMNNNHMILARDLTLHDPKNTHWELIDPKDTKFKEVAALLKKGTQSFAIKTTINFDSLLPRKTYVVYLIFKTTPGASLDAVLTATVSTEIDELKDVCLSFTPKVGADQKSGNIKLPVQSPYDEWMELELGEFLCSNIAAKRVAEISIKVKGNSKYVMWGVYVAGIELRSKSY